MDPLIIKYKKFIKTALTIKYNAIVAEQAIDYLEDQEFDADGIKEDIEDDDDVANCSLIIDLSEKMPKLFKNDNQKQILLQILRDALNGKMPAKAKTVVNVNGIKYDLMKRDQKKTKEYIKTKLNGFLIVNDDQALIDVIAIGRKNGIPLLMWLTDTHSRYRINHFIRTNGKDLLSGNFVREYKLFSNLTGKGKKLIVNKLDSAIKSFYKRMFNQINLKRSLLIIDDSINEYIDYCIIMNSVIERLITDNQVLPTQIDCWIIPKNVAQSTIAATSTSTSTSNAAMNDTASDDDSDSDDDDGDSDIDDNLKSQVDPCDLIGNIDHRLNINKYNFIKYQPNDLMEYPKVIRGLTTKIQSMINNRRSQRIVILIDRRNPAKYVNMSVSDFQTFVSNGYSTGNNNNDDQKQQSKKNKIKKTWKDTIYITQSSQPKFASFPAKPTPETSFWSTVQSMLPIINEERVKRKNLDYGSKNPMEGAQFTLSWHINTVDQIRCYWFNNCWGTRFLPSDCIHLWPLVFKNNNITNERKDKLKNIIPIKDDAFLSWYKQTTGKPLITT